MISLKYIRVLTLLLIASICHAGTDISNGQVQASSQPVCFMNYYLNASSLTVIEVQYQWELIAGTGTLIVYHAGDDGDISTWFGEWYDAVGHARGVICRAKKTFRYLIKFSGCIRSPQVTGSIPEFGIFINDSLYEEVETSPYLANQAKDSTFAIACTARLSEDDVVTLKIKNKSGTEDYQLDHMQVNIFTVGG